MSDTEGLQIRQYLAILWRWLWLIVVAALVTAGAAFLASRRTIPTYEAYTTLLIDGPQRPAGPSYDTILMSERLAKTYTVLFKARPTLDEAARRLGALSGAELDRVVRVERVLDTQLVRLKVRHTDPALAARVANTLCEVFIEHNRQRNAERVAGSLERLDRELRVLQDGIASTQIAIDQERAKEPADPANLARLDTLISQYRTSYVVLLQDYDEMRAAATTGFGAVSVVEPAQPPKTPVLPRTGVNTIVAGLVGAMLAAGMVLAIQQLDDTVKDAEDVERSAELPVLAMVSHFAKPTGPEPVIASRPSSAPAEAFRILRTSVQLSTAGMPEPAVTLLVASPMLHEGRTTVVANLGVSLAQIGKRVVLVDCDLRRPSLHKHFGLENVTGLTSLLAGPDDSLEYAIQKTTLPGLCVLTSGLTPPSPAELLDSRQMTTLLAQLKPLADYVILDSPPALGLADAAILAQKVDGVVLVAASGRTRSEACRRLLTVMRGAKARLLGVVLNDVAAKASRHYYAYDDRSARRKERGKSATRGELPLDGHGRHAAGRRTNSEKDGLQPSGASAGLPADSPAARS